MGNEASGALLAPDLVEKYEFCKLEPKSAKLENHSRVEGVSSFRLWAALFFVLAMPGMIAGYNSFVEQLAADASVDPSCVDPLNIAFAIIPLPKLDIEPEDSTSVTGVPVCVWNLTHISFFAFVTYHLRCYFQRPQFDRFLVKSIYVHQIVALMIGILWYFVEPHIFSAIASKETVMKNSSCRKLGWNVVYDNTWRPRKEDIYFNLLGQLLVWA